MAKKRPRLSRPLDFPADGDAFVAALNEAAKDSPRAAAIVAAALVEDALRWCLCGFLIPAGAEQAELPAEDQAAVFDNENAPLKTLPCENRHWIQSRNLWKNHPQNLAQY